MGKDRVVVDLIGQEKVRTAITVEHKAICCPYQERPNVINDVIQVVCVHYKVHTLYVYVQYMHVHVLYVYANFFSSVSGLFNALSG